MFFGSVLKGVKRIPKSVLTFEGNSSNPDMDRRYTKSNCSSFGKKRRGFKLFAYFFPPNCPIQTIGPVCIVDNRSSSLSFYRKVILQELKLCEISCSVPLYLIHTSPLFFQSKFSISRINCCYVVLYVFFCLKYNKCESVETQDGSE